MYFSEIRISQKLHFDDLFTFGSKPSILWCEAMCFVSIEYRLFYFVNLAFESIGYNIRLLCSCYLAYLFVGLFKL